MRSLKSVGTPANGPSGRGPAACLRARSNNGWITAFSSGLSFSTRLIAASTSSSGETWPVRTSSAWAVASSVAKSSVIELSVGRSGPEARRPGASRRPAPEVDRPGLDDVVAVGDVHPLVERDRRVDVRGPDPHPLADARSRAGLGTDGDVLVRAEQHFAGIHARVAVIHAERLE